MKLKRSILAITLALSLVSAACDKNLLAISNDIVVSLRAAQPLIVQLLPKASGKIESAITIAEKIKDAVAKSDAKGAAALLSDLIPVFQDIVNKDLRGLTASQQTEILAALALANIGLHFLVDRLQSSAPAMMTAIPDAKARALDSFAAEAVWGRRYRK